MATSEVSGSDENDILDLQEQIDKANIIQAISLCHKLHLPCENAVSLEDIKDILYDHLEKEKEKNGEQNDSDRVTNENLQRIIKNIIEKDAEMKEFLYTIYVLINELIEMPQFDECFNAELTTRYGDYRAILKTNQEKLKQVDCPIVVTGETSAGKSSFLNLMIGSEILPVSLLRCTSTICKLRNSDSKRVVVYDENDIEAQSVDVKSDDDLTEMLKEYTCYNNDLSYDQMQYKHVDIYWPIPMLPENVIIVDTPGIGDTEEMTTIVLEYLENAIAFIYVINSANAGGVQSDRILKVIDQQTKLKKEGKLHIFDPRLAVFVCNKWNHVPESDKEKVWANTKQKIKRSWMGLQDDQIIKISVHEEIRRRNNGLHYTKSFRRLLNFVNSMIPASLEGKVKIHAIWMKEFLNLVYHSNVVKINFSFQTLEEKEDTKKKVETRLKKLTDKKEKVKEEMLKFLKSKQDKIALDLLYHLQSNKEKLSTWALSECPSAATIAPYALGIFSTDHLEETKKVAKEKIISRLQDEISDWLLDNDDASNLQKDISEKLKTQLQLLQDEYNIIQKEMRGVSFSDVHLSSTTSNMNGNSSTILLKFCVAGAFTSVGMALSPILIITAPITGLVLATFHAIYRSEVKKCTKFYKENRQKFMKKWTLEFLDSLKKPSLYDWLDKWYFRDARGWIESVFDDEIPKIIETDRQIMELAILDESKAMDVVTLLKPFHEKAAECQGKVALFNLRYLSDRYIHQDKIRKGGLIGDGTHAYVYKSEIYLDGEWIQVALNKSKYPLENATSYLQLRVLKNVFDFDHRNVLKIYGASVVHDGKNMVLEIVTELCEMTLKEMIDKTSCSVLGTEEFANPFRLFVNLTIQIAEGLEYIHARECVHMDLKMEKILIQEDRVKIGHVGFPKLEELSRSSVTESLSDKTHFSKEQNVHSFGKIMWQMWHHKQVSGESHHPKYESAKDMQGELKKGALSSFPLLGQLLESCLHDDPLKRPNITEVKERLIKFRNKHMSIVV